MAYDKPKKQMFAHEGGSWANADTAKSLTKPTIIMTSLLGRFASYRLTTALLADNCCDQWGQGTTLGKDENCFTLTRTRHRGTMAAASGGQKGDPVHTCGAGDARVELRRSLRSRKNVGQVAITLVKGEVDDA